MKLRRPLGLGLAAVTAAVALSGCTSSDLGGPPASTDTSADAQNYSSSVQSGMLTVGTDFQTVNADCPAQGTAWGTVQPGSTCYNDLVTARTDTETYLANLTSLTPPDDQASNYTAIRSAINQIAAGTDELVNAINNNNQPAANAAENTMQAGENALGALGYSLVTSDPTPTA